jgi:hypothetical protein
MHVYTNLILRFDKRVYMGGIHLDTVHNILTA